MKFQPGIGYPFSRRPRGPGRKQYRMSEAALRARWQSAARARHALAQRHGRQECTPEETQRIQVEAALWTQRGGESW